MDIFKEKQIKPMLLSDGEPFDSPDYIFELKFDGIRAIAYLEKTNTTLINRNGKNLTSLFPELQNLHTLCKLPCIMDGEIIALENGKPDFFKVQKRVLTAEKIKTEYYAKTEPTQFVAFDILYKNKEDLTRETLLKRKDILLNVTEQSPRLVISKFIDACGKNLFAVAKKENFEGIVAKHKKSTYRQNQRTRDWIKIKVFHDEDFIIAGYLKESESGKIKALYFAKKQKNIIQDMGLHGFNLNKMDSDLILNHAENLITKNPLIDILPENQKLHQLSNKPIIWLKPKLVCTIKYSEKTKDGNLRTPVFKELKKSLQ